MLLGSMWPSWRSNVALCVNPNETYVKVKSGNDNYYMAEALLGSILGEDYEVLESYIGKDLEFKAYEPLYPCQSLNKKAYYVTCEHTAQLSRKAGPHQPPRPRRRPHHQDKRQLQVYDRRRFGGRVPFDMRGCRCARAVFR